MSGCVLGVEGWCVGDGWSGVVVPIKGMGTQYNVLASPPLGDRTPPATAYYILIYVSKRCDGSEMPP